MNTHFARRKLGLALFCFAISAFAAVSAAGGIGVVVSDVGLAAPTGVAPPVAAVRAACSPTARHIQRALAGHDQRRACGKRESRLAAGRPGSRAALPGNNVACLTSGPARTAAPARLSDVL